VRTPTYGSDMTLMNELETLFQNAEKATRSGKHGEAIGYYEKILEKSSPNASAHHLAHWGIGDIHLNAKDYSRAELHLKRAIELSPKAPNYHYLLGCCYTYIDETDKAIEHLRIAKDLAPNHDVILGQLGWVVGYNRDVEEGISYLKKALSINPSNTASLKDICLLFAQSQKWGEALVCIEEALKHNPADQEDIKRIRINLEFFRSEFQRLERSSGKIGKDQ